MSLLVACSLIAGCGQAASTDLPDGTPLYFSTLAEAKTACDLEDMDWLMLRLWPDGVPEGCDSCRGKFQTSRGMLGFEFRDSHAAKTADRNGLAGMQQSLALTATFGGILLWQWMAGGTVVTTGFVLYLDPEDVSSTASDLGQAVSELGDNTADTFRAWGSVLTSAFSTAASVASPRLADDPPGSVNDVLAHHPRLADYYGDAIKEARRRGHCGPLFEVGQVPAMHELLDSASYAASPGIIPVLYCSDVGGTDFVSHQFIYFNVSYPVHTVRVVNIGTNAVEAGAIKTPPLTVVPPWTVGIFPLYTDVTLAVQDNFCFYGPKQTKCIPIFPLSDNGSAGGLRPILPLATLAGVGSVSAAVLDDDQLESKCDDHAEEITCNSGVLPGNTQSGHNYNSGYLCTPSWDYSGPEKVYKLLGMSRNLTVRLVTRESESADWVRGLPEDSGQLDLFVLDDGCQAYNADGDSSCLVGGQTEHYFSASQDRVYYIIVDGRGTDSGRFNLQILCD